MKKRVLMITLVVVGALAMTSSLVWANGGSAKGGDVCWMADRSGVLTEVHAIFYKTNSGIVHEWRYSPEHAHLVFKPQASFPEPDEGSWFSWQYKGQYDACDPPSDDSLSDFLDLYAWYWVEITWQ